MMDLYDLQNKLFLISLKAAIIRDNNTILLLRSTAPHKHWEMPGGIVNMNETFSDGLTREVKEETAMRFIIGDLIFVWDYWYKNFRLKDGSIHDVRVVEIIYHCQPLINDITLSEEHSEYIWAPKEKLNDLPMFSCQRQAALDIL